MPGATVAAYVKEQLAAEGVDVVSRSAACAGFLGKVALPPGTRYAVLTTEAGPKPDKKTGRMPTEEELAKAEQELAKYQRVRPIMNEILQGKALVSVGEDKVHVTGLKGPLEDGWQEKVRAFVGRIAVTSAESGGERVSGQPHATAA